MAPVKINNRRQPMKAPIESPLTLEAVAGHFEQWRRNKKKGERIPEHLWSEAIDLVGLG
jgi:hypothetical protein